MNKHLLPFNIRPYVRTRVDVPVHEDHRIYSRSQTYYDILADVYNQDGHRPTQNFIISTDVDDDYYNYTPYGLIEYSSLEDVVACAAFLYHRDRVPTFITGVFGGEPFNQPFLLFRYGPDIFNEYIVTHNGYIYHSSKLVLNKFGFISPNIVYSPETAAMDMDGYLTYTLPTKVGGNMSIRVHELVGMTFWPKMYRNSEMFIYHHRNGDKTDNHFQNIGGICV